jgi:hypothetical protein
LDPFAYPGFSDKPKKPIIGYGQQYGLTYNGFDEDVQKEQLSLPERNELLDTLSEYGAPAVSGLFDGLDWLGSQARSAITGKEDATEEEVLKAAGLLPSEEALGGWGRPIAKIAAGIATDPLTYTGLGALGSAATQAGKAAKAAGFLDDAARAASRTQVGNIISGAAKADDLSWIGKRAQKQFLDDTGTEITRLSDEDLFARPLIGQGQARRDMTLGELLERQRDWGQAHYDESLENLQDFFARNGGDLASLQDTKLTNDINFGLPVNGWNVGFNVPLGESAMKAADAVGDYLRWDALGIGRYAHAAFDQSVHGATQAADQIELAKLSRSDAITSAAGRREANRVVSLLPQFKDAATDIRMGNAIRNVIEEVGPTLAGDARVAHDEVLKALTDFRAGTATGEAAQIGQFIDEWKNLSKRYIDRSRDVGIGGGELDDTFGTQYFPRVLDDATFNKGGGGPSRGTDYSRMTSDQIARKASFHVPGGTNTLQELSLDPRLAGQMRTAANDELAADIIQQVMQQKIGQLRAAGRPMVDATGAPLTYSRQNAISLAKTLREIDPDAIAKKLPIFGQHPAESVAKYITGREKAMGRAGVIYNTLGRSAMPVRHTQVTGGGADSALDTLNDLGLNTIDRRGLMLPPGVADIEGAKVQLLDRLHAIGLKNGITEFAYGNVDSLSNVSFDSRAIKTLQRIADFYEVPEVQSSMFKILDAVTTLWKSSILAWPSRFVRDFYSGAFSNFVLLSDSIPFTGTYTNAYASAKRLIQAQPEELDKYLQMMPRYMKYGTPEERMQKYLGDLAAAGISKGRQLEDVGQSALAKQSGEGIRAELHAGAAPQTTALFQLTDLPGYLGLGPTPLSSRHSAAAELFDAGNWKKSLSGSLQTIADAYQGKKSEELINPVLRASAKLGDTTDKLNRIAGYNGLLMQGVSPEEAARRVMEFHVDYSSLTKFEKGWIRNAIPFWSYQSRIGKWALKQIVTKPGGAFTQAGIRAPDVLSQNGAEDEYVPARIADKYGISLEPMRALLKNDPTGISSSVLELLAPADASVSSWISDIDLPGIDQINMFRPKVDAETGQLKPVGTATSSLLSLAEGAHPLIKAGVELGTGRDTYTGIKKNYARSTLPKVLSNLGVLGPEDYKWADFLGGVDTALQFGLPGYSRTGQLVRRMTDPRLESPATAGLQALFNAFTGAKIENIDDQEKTRDALDKISQILADDPAVRNFESTYIPKELLPVVDERTRQLYQLDRQLRKERRQIQKVKPDRYNPLNY